MKIDVVVVVIDVVMEEKGENMCDKSNLETVLDPSFFQNSCPRSRPVFREISVQEYEQNEEQTIKETITSWPTDISLLPSICHSKIKNYMIDGTISLDNRSRGAYKHKIQGYQLFKESYVKKVRVKPNVAGEHLLFAVKCFVAASMKKDKYTVNIHLEKTLEMFYMDIALVKKDLVVAASMLLLHYTSLWNTKNST